MAFRGGSEIAFQLKISILKLIFGYENLYQDR